MAMHYRYIGIALQSFAIFAAFLTLLGRIYFLSYYEALGIPISDVRINAIEYSIISPDVSVFAVGISVSISIHFWLRSWLNIFIASIQYRFIWGIICILAGWLVLSVAILYRQFFEFSFMAEGLNGLVVTFGFVLSFFGGYMMGREPRTPIEREQADISNGKSRYKHEVQRVLVFVLISAMLIIYIVLYSMFYSSSSGAWDASNKIIASPKVEVEFNSSKAERIYQDALNNCNDNNGNCHIRLIHISDKFVYLSVARESRESEHYQLYSFLIDEISHIHYIRGDSSS